MQVVRANAVEIAYEHVGEGPSLVFVHGAAEDARVWRPQLAALANEFTVVARDEPGAALRSVRCYCSTPEGACERRRAYGRIQRRAVASRQRPAWPLQRQSRRLEGATVRADVAVPTRRHPRGRGWVSMLLELTITQANFQGAQLIHAG